MTLPKEPKSKDFDKRFYLLHENCQKMLLWLLNVLPPTSPPVLLINKTNWRVFFPRRDNLIVGRHVGEMLTTSLLIQEVVGSILTLMPAIYLEFACSPRDRVDFSLGSLHI